MESARLNFLHGGGEAGARMRAFDWAATRLGAAQLWPQSLKTIVRVMLDSRYAMWMLWGPDLTFFCNDAYLPTVGIKRDWVIGARSDVVWQEIWPDIGPRIARVLAQGEATWDEGLLLYLERSGFPEETYHTFSYSPVYDDDNRIAGMLCVVTEVTERVIGERRLRMLRDLAARSLGPQTIAAVCTALVAVLEENPLDIPFSSVYVLGDAGTATLCAHHGTLPARLRPTELPLEGPDALFAEGSLQEGSAIRIFDLPAGADELRAPSWPDRITKAVVIPIRHSGSTSTVALLIAGVSPRRPIDDGYLRFCELVGGQFASAISDAQATASASARAEALAEIDRAKTLFFSNVSHEFRTPLTLLLSPLEETLADPALPAVAMVPLRIAHRNALRLSKLVNSLLDFARIEAGRIEAVYEPVDLAALTADLASQFTSAMQRAGLEFTVTCTLDEPVYVDRGLWEKIVLNLLSNALKFTLTGGVLVRLRARGRTAVLEVIDSGVGIAPAELPRVFERFHRIEGSAGRTHEGSGIGLALVQELAKLHGGDVEVESQLGLGTTFRVCVPLGSAHLPSDRIAQPQDGAGPGPRSRGFLEEAEGWLATPEPDNSPPALAVPARARGDGARANERPLILLADDNGDMRDYVRRLLEPDYDVLAVADGEAALGAARRRRPALVLSDVMMPKLDGFGMLRALRADPATATVPVILLSARAGQEAVVQGLDAGADDYLLKPFSARELLARVAGAIALARVRADVAEQLRDADRRKDEFLAMLGHELRNPLAPIGNAVEILSRILGPDERAHRALGTARRQVMQLTRLVDDLLDVSRITQGRIELRREALDVDAVITQAVAAVEPQLRDKQHRIAIDRSEPRALTVHGDPARLMQCIVNVLSNSAKYTDRGGEIRIRTRLEGGFVVIAIVDSGVGIAPHLLPHVFDLFVQGERTLDRSEGGLGVGLAVVRRLIEMHEGTVTASSVGSGRGSTVEIRLPALGAAHASAHASGSPAPPPRRVLVVDDNRDSADSLALLLQMDGHETATAYSAREALERALSLKPQVVLLDIGLPEIDGYEIARRLRGQSDFADTCLIALTGYGQAEDRKRARGAGFDEHLIKPADLGKLRRAIALHVEREPAVPRE